MSEGKKISKGEKLAIVKRCLSGELGVGEAGRQVGVNQQSIREWINRYEAAEEGLTPAQGWRRYPKELKEAAVKDYLDGKGSLEGICNKYKIRSTHPLQNWIEVYNSHKVRKNTDIRWNYLAVCLVYPELPTIVGLAEKMQQRIGK